jgi:para-aminobenzoate synthetase component I
MTLVIQEVFGRGNPPEEFARIASRPGSFFLDSALPDTGRAGYSFLGCDPFLRVRGTHVRSSIFERGIEENRSVDVLDSLRALFRRFAAASDPRLPFVGGAVGYLPYEYGAQWEGIGLAQANRARAPEVEFAFYDGLLGFEHASGKWFAVANPMHDASAEEILRRIEGWQNLPMAPGEAGGKSLATTPECPSSREDYLDGVKRIKEYIAAGDVYQVNLAQRFAGEWRGDASLLYARLRATTPAPHGCFLRTSFGHILSCSPERFLRLDGGRVETRPIKGTRPRGRNASEDSRLAEELRGSAKERAELLMIVDLERNDLGRVCRPGSIEVSDLYRIEVHPTVFHLVATVSGRLRDECDVFDLLRATFPGGSITGAPKIRAMQIIEELEPASRGVYTGAIGYVGFDGRCDFNIAIRTVVLEGHRASYHVGAGIVWDSDPESEYEETLAKGQALQRAFAENFPR